MTEVHRGGTNQVEDAGELARRVLKGFEWFLVGVLYRLIRITLSQVLSADDMVLV